jgi:ABC-type amino acid transport substrate-binding protein
VIRRIILAITLLTTAAAVPLPAQAPTERGHTGLSIDLITSKWTGDFDGMVERRIIRVLTAHNKTLYFIDRGTERGMSADQGRLLEAELNKTLATGALKINVVFIPVSRGELLPALLEGRGDVVMGNLTITPERQKQVDVVDPGSPTWTRSW